MGYRLPTLHKQTKKRIECMNFEAVETYILKKLEEELPNHLFYHGLHHTKDVFSAALNIALEEGITESSELTMLKTASLYHDAGFTVDYQNHEENGCVLARKTLPEFGFTTNEIETICGMIMATKIPQSPQNKLEEILCDADLDYLGRDDFYKIGDTLFSELNFFKLVSDQQQWNRIQVSFLSNHKYFTNYGRSHREGQKQLYLNEIKKVVDAY